MPSTISTDSCLDLDRTSVRLAILNVVFVKAASHIKEQRSSVVWDFSFNPVQNIGMRCTSTYVVKPTSAFPDTYSSILSCIYGNNLTHWNFLSWNLSPRVYSGVTLGPRSESSWHGWHAFILWYRGRLWYTQILNLHETKKCRVSCAR